MNLSVFQDPEEDFPVMEDFKHLVETESITCLNDQINRLMISGWQLCSVKRVSKSDGSDVWHALLQKTVLSVSSIEIG